jgi:hypothetical protein
MIAKEAKKKNRDWLQTNVFENINEEIIEVLYENNKKIKEGGLRVFLPAHISASKFPACITQKTVYEKKRERKSDVEIPTTTETVFYSSVPCDIKT